MLILQQQQLPLQHRRRRRLARCGDVTPSGRVHKPSTAHPYCAVFTFRIIFELHEVTDNVPKPQI